MANFNRGGRSGGGRSFGKRDFSGSRSMGRPQMHNAICDNCGKECQVPFKPTGEKPVYCRDCFAKMGGGDSRNNFERNNRSERPQQENQQLAEVNRKLDKILELLNLSVEKQETPSN